MSKFKNFVFCFTIQCSRYGGIHIFEEHSSSTLTTEGVRFFDMLVTTYHTIDCHKPDGLNINIAVVISHCKYFNASYKNSRQMFGEGVENRAMPC